LSTRVYIIHAVGDEDAVQEWRSLLEREGADTLSSPFPGMEPNKLAAAVKPDDNVLVFLSPELQENPGYQRFRKRLGAGRGNVVQVGFKSWKFQEVPAGNVIVLDAPGGQIDLFRQLSLIERAALHPNAAPLKLPPLQIPQELINACASGRSILFPGAGLSAQSGCPLRDAWAEMLLDWAFTQKIFDQPLEESLSRALEQGMFDLVTESIYQTAAGEGHGHALRDFLKEIFLSPGWIPSLSHRTLAKIGFSGAITWNYDDLLEKAMAVKEASVFTPDNGMSLHERLSQKDPFILKLFGAVNRPKTIFFSISQFQETVARNPTFAAFMRDLYLTRTFFFMGMNPDGIADVLDSLDLRVHPGHKHYLLLGVTPENASLRAKEKLFKQRYGLEFLLYDCTEGHQQFQDFIQDLAYQVGKTKPINLSKKNSPYLREMVLEDFGPFHHLQLNLHPQWNVLLGDNGVGKTHILRAMAMGLSRTLPKRPGNLIRNKLESARIVLSRENRDLTLTLGRSVNRVSMTCSPDNLPTMDADSHLLIGFPAVRGLMGLDMGEDPNLLEIQAPTSADLNALINADIDPRSSSLSQWLVTLDHTIKSRKDASRLQSMMDRFFLILNDLTPNVKLKFSHVEPETKTVIMETDDGLVPIEAVSQGMASMLSLIGALLRRFYAVYEWDEPWKMPAVALIDEIDAHMHPRWQYRMVQTLSTHFPKTQFIVTTHSPLIVAGLPADQVIRLIRDENGNICATPMDDEASQGRTDQILTSRLFGMKTTLDPTTENMLEEYKRISSKNKLRPGDEHLMVELENGVKARTQPPWETPPERQAQLLLHALLREQVGDQYPEIQEEVLKRAEKLFTELKARSL